MARCRLGGIAPCEQGDPSGPRRLGRWALHQGNPQAFLCLAKPDSTQDRNPLHSPRDHCHGGVALLTCACTGLCRAFGHLFHGILTVAMGRKFTEAAVVDCCS